MVARIIPKSSEVAAGRHPETMSAAVDELLKFESPVQLSSRSALETVQISGRTIPSGDFVVLAKVELEIALRRLFEMFPMLRLPDIERVVWRLVGYEFWKYSRHLTRPDGSSYELPWGFPRRLLVAILCLSLGSQIAAWWFARLSAWFLP